MTGQRIGYKRVSTLDQNTARQLDGEPVDKCFSDKASGKDKERPRLRTALDYCREGDTLVVHWMDRLARSLVDLRSMVDDLTRRGVAIEFVKENQRFVGEDASMAILLLSLLGAITEFGRSLILERQREGIAIASLAGKYKGRRRTPSAVQADEIRNCAAARRTQTPARQGLRNQPRNPVLLCARALECTLIATAVLIAVFSAEQHSVWAGARLQWRFPREGKMSPPNADSRRAFLNLVALASSSQTWLSRKLVLVSPVKSRVSTHLPMEPKSTPCHRSARQRSRGPS